MANEILKNEQLTENQLDGVAGGTMDEWQKDISFFQEIGLFPKYDGDVSIENGTIEKIFDNAGVKMVFNDDTPNEYSINGKSVSRKEALQRVLDVQHIRMSLDKYL